MPALYVTMSEGIEDTYLFGDKGCNNAHLILW